MNNHYVNRNVIKADFNKKNLLHVLGNKQTTIRCGFTTSCQACFQKYKNIEIDWWIIWNVRHRQPLKCPQCQATIRGPIMERYSCMWGAALDTTCVLLTMGWGGGGWEVAGSRPCPSGNGWPPRMWLPHRATTKYSKALDCRWSPCSHYLFLSTPAKKGAVAYVCLIVGSASTTSAQR